MTDAAIRTFFADKPEALRCYQVLWPRLCAACGPVQMRVQKTQITWSNRRVFGCASLPRGKAMRGAALCVTFGLGFRLTAPRVALAVEPYRGRWTHHVPLTRPEEIDDELLGWLRDAYDFAALK